MFSVLLRFFSNIRMRIIAALLPNDVDKKTMRGLEERVLFDLLHPLGPKSVRKGKIWNCMSIHQDAWKKSFISFSYPPRDPVISWWEHW